MSRADSPDDDGIEWDALVPDAGEGSAGSGGDELQSDARTRLALEEAAEEALDNSYSMDPEDGTRPPQASQPFTLSPDLNPFGCNATELQFAMAYATWGNLDMAAQSAGLTGGSSIGRKILDRPHVAAEVKRLRAKAMDLAAVQKEEPDPVKPQEIMEHLQAIATLDPIDAMIEKPNGQLDWKSLKDMPKNVRRAIKRVRLHTDGSVELEFYDKLSGARAALDALRGFRKMPKLPVRPAERQDDTNQNGEVEINGPRVTAVPKAGNVVPIKALSYEELVANERSRLDGSVRSG